MDVPPELLELSRFHGHLGVYVTLGLRMGQIGQRTFGHHKGLRAIVRSDLSPPMRCVVDGVQFSSGCTMGKGNIAIASADGPEVVFSKEGRALRIAVRPAWRRRIAADMSKELEVEQSVFYYGLPESDLFDITGPEPSRPPRSARTTKMPGSRRRAAGRPRRP